MLLDDFNRADGALGANYSNVAGYTGNPTIASNRIAPAAAGTSVKYWNPSTFTGDQYARLDFPVMASADRGIGPAIKINPAGGTFYHVHVTASAVELRKNDSTVTDGGAWPTSYAISAGNVVEIRMVGSVLSLFINDVERIRYTDGSALTGTSVGFVHFYGDTAFRADNFYGGLYVPVGAGNVPSIIRQHHAMQR